MEEPKAWTPATPAQGATKPPVALWQRIAMGVAGIAVIGIGLMQISSGLGMIGGGGSFDPAKPPALGNPAPGIIKHLEAKARGQSSRPGEFAPIEQFVSEARASLPHQIDTITTVVGVYSAGRHIALDNRIMLIEPVADLKAYRQRLKDGLTNITARKLCAPEGADTLQFLRQNNATLTHAYTVNDGKETFFIEVSPATCDAQRPPA